MADIFAFSSTKPRTISTLLLAVSALFLFLGAPLMVYGLSNPSTPENEMLPFILLLCGVLLCATGGGMLAIGLGLRRKRARS